MRPSHGKQAVSHRQPMVFSAIETFSNPRMHPTTKGDVTRRTAFWHFRCPNGASRGAYLFDGGADGMIGRLVQAVGTRVTCDDVQSQP